MYHSAPETAVLNLGSGMVRSQSLARVRDKIAGEPFEFYLSSSRSEKGDQKLRFVLSGTGSAGVCLNPTEYRVKSPWSFNCLPDYGCLGYGFWHLVRFLWDIWVLVLDGLREDTLLTLLQLPLIEVGNAVKADCYSIASYP